MHSLSYQVSGKDILVGSPICFKEGMNVSGFTEYQMEFAQEVAELRLGKVMAVLAERIGEQELVTFVIDGELAVMKIGENNPWFRYLQEMKAQGERCRRVWNQAIGSHMIIVIGQVAEEHVKECSICSAG